MEYASLTDENMRLIQIQAISLIKCYQLTNQKRAPLQLYQLYQHFGSLFFGAFTVAVGQFGPRMNTHPAPAPTPRFIMKLEVLELKKWKKPKKKKKSWTQEDTPAMYLSDKNLNGSESLAYVNIKTTQKRQLKGTLQLFITLHH